MGARAERGVRGEEVAARHLRAAGYRILARNWRSGRRELDLIALDGRTVVFVEVKTRGDGPQHPLEALDRRQRRRLRSAAEAWIHAHPGVGREFRFDLLGVRLRRGEAPTVHHLPDAFHGEDC